MVSEILIHKAPESATEKCLDEIVRCYAEIYSIEVCIRWDDLLVTYVGEDFKFVTDDLLRCIRGSDPNPFYIDVNCRVRVRLSGTLGPR